MQFYKHTVELITRGGFLPYILVFFSAALLSLGSCTLIRIPIVMGYMGGFADSRRKAFRLLLGFIMGIIISYTLLGFLLGKIAGFISKSVHLSYYFYIMAGIILISLGLNLLDLLPFKFLSSKCKAPVRGKASFWGAVILGFIFAFFEAPVCPCCGPMLLLISTNVLTTGKFGYALGIFITYSIGQSLPLLILGLSATAFQYVEKFHHLEEYIKLGAGTVLFYFGIYLIWLA
jgi:cytochrome c-type biogenesis protein